jgi:hypothetical protein
MAGFSVLQIREGTYIAGGLPGIAARSGTGAYSKPNGGAAEAFDKKAGQQ